ncbi:MAG: hypothetical protein WCA35_16080, partial [Kovacikia sp.]
MVIETRVGKKGGEQSYDRQTEQRWHKLRFNRIHKVTGKEQQRGIAGFTAQLNPDDRYPARRGKSGIWDEIVLIFTFKDSDPIGIVKALSRQGKAFTTPSI